MLALERPLGRRFVSRGAWVIMAARRFDRLEALADELGELAGFE
jgi:NADP-dependent 3-hydroxy acid dehydrogenase YdfG